MTRMLSHLLEAQEPDFRLSLQQLERASGHPNADIRLTSELTQHVQAKLRELGLDPQDTTAEELYGVLNQHLLTDEQQLRQQLGLASDATPADIQASVRRFVEALPIPMTCFALKFSVAKRLLKAVPPKKAMKALGYRSLDSMLKHEAVPQLYVAASLYEAPQWRTDFLAQYNHLNPSDFELRQLSLYAPNRKAWQRIVAELAAHEQLHLSVALSELGAVVLLPTQIDLPAQAITTTLLLLEGVSEVRSCSAYLKLQQVRRDFGNCVQAAAEQEPSVAVKLAGRNLPWRILQHFYATAKLGSGEAAWFEPQLQADDLSTIEAAKLLAHAVPALNFWEDCAALALLKDDQAVSFNMLDVALGVANRFPFLKRVLHYGRQELWQDLLVRYLGTMNLTPLLETVSQPALEVPAEQTSIEDPAAPIEANR
jgi:hypothetical protein